MEAVHTAHTARREEAKFFTVKYRQQENGGGRGDHRGDEKRPGKTAWKVKIRVVTNKKPKWGGVQCTHTHTRACRYTRR